MFLSSVFASLSSRCTLIRFPHFLRNFATKPVVGGSDNLLKELNGDGDGDGDSLDADVVLKKVERKEVYSTEALKSLNFDKYPYYIEREWWKRGKRMTFWSNWRMLRDIRRREALAELGPLRLCLKAIKSNTILPQAIRDECAERMFSLGRLSHPKRILNHCQFTGAKRGKLKIFRLNRHTMRHLGDHGRLSGVQRAMWT